MSIPILLFLAASAWWDWKYRKVPNVLVILLGSSGLLFHVFSGNGLLPSIFGIVIGFGLTIFPVLLKRMGIGDQKLLMALGAWIGGYKVYFVFLLALFISCLPVLANPGRWNQLYHNMYGLTVGWMAHKRLWFPEINQSAYSLPFAVSLAASYCLILLGERF